MESLLAKAKAFDTRRKPAVDKQVAILSVAWAAGEITLSQVRSAIEVDGSNAYSVLARGLRDAMSMGLIQKVKAKS